MIRKAKLKDIDNIIKIDKFGKLLNSFSGLDKIEKSSDSKKYYRNAIYSNNDWVYVAEEDKKVAGFIFFSIQNREEFWKIKKVGYLELIFIDKKHRGKGIAKELIDKFKKTMKEKKIKYLKLSVQTDNTFAHDFWKKQGFKDYRVDMWSKL